MQLPEPYALAASSPHRLRDIELVGNRLRGKLDARIRTQDGFHTMRLDTGRPLTEAIDLYKSLGFQQQKTPDDLPDDLAELLLCFERRL